MLKKSNFTKNSAVLGFKDGMTHFFIGQRFVYVEHRELFKYFIVPMCVGALLFAAGMFLFINWIDDLVSWVWTKPESWYLQIVWYIFKTVFVLVSFTTILLLSFLSFMISAAPFNDVISENVEGILGTWNARPFSWGFLFSDLWQSIALELARIGMKLAWIVPLYIGSLVIPVIGPLVYMIVGGYKISKFLGMDYVDWSLARRGYSWSERFQFSNENKWALVGFGLCMMVAVMIPLGFVVFWPGAIAGGTILCTRLNPQDRRKDSQQMNKPALSP